MGKAFILGGTGLIGFGIAQALESKGWTVYATARSEDKAKLLSKNEITPVITVAKETKNWEHIAASCDVIIEALAEYSDPETVPIVQKTLQAIAKKDSTKLVIYTSGCWIYGNGDGKNAVDENTTVTPLPIVAARPAIEKSYLDFGAIVVRPGCVFGRGGSLTASWFKAVSESKGEIILPGDEQTNWAMVHVTDLSELYALVAEKGHSFRGHIFNGITSHSNVKHAVEAVAHALNVKATVKFVAPQDPFSQALAIHSLASSQKARTLLGWNPKKPTFEASIPTLAASWKSHL